MLVAFSWQRRGEAKGVGILLWYNSGGDHNSVGEGPRDEMHEPAKRREELAKISGWGVRGIKVDFFLSDKPARIAQYLGIARDAAAEHLLVNYHGSTIPHGFQRTYPNIVSFESVLGAEYHKFSAGPDPTHHVMLTMTRNVVGSMDYAPAVAGTWPVSPATRRRVTPKPP